MTYKRYIYLFIMLGLLPISCWKKENNLHFIFDNVSVYSYNDDSLNTPIQQTDTIVNEKIYFKLDLNISYLASNNYAVFGNELFATSKPRKGQNGLKVKLNDINIVSDKLFRGQSPGTNLNDFFSWHDIGWDKQMKTINQLKDRFNENEFFLGGSFYSIKLILNQKPNDSLSHKFTFNFAYSDGSIQTTTTNKINWK